jgi:hypothetical protein
MGILIVSFVLGVIVGFATRRSDLGAGIAAGGFALVAASQGLLAWVYG